METENELIAEGKNLLRETETIFIKSANDYEHWVGIEGAKVKVLERKIIAHYAPSKAAASAAHKAICAAEKKHLEMPKKIMALIEAAALKYRLAQAEIRKKAESLAREKAQKEAEEARIELALKAEAAGNKEQARQLIDAPILAVAPVFSQTPIPKIAGNSVRKNWKARVIAGQEHLIPREFLIPDMAKLNAHAKAFESTFNVPGAEAFNDETMSYRRNL